MKKWILPAVAAVVLVLAATVVIKSVADGGEAESADNGAGANSAAVSGLTLSVDELSNDAITFVRPLEDSKIELLARIGDDGDVKVALGTCQSCNGSPGAYYTQEGDVLKCNNCQLTFEQSVVDNPGGGCHPITTEESLFTLEGDDIVFDADMLAKYESLFDQVEEH